LSQNEEEQWKKEKLDTAIKHYKHVLDKLPSIQLETKRKIQINLAQVLFDAQSFDEAVILYEIAFNVRSDLLFY
jgi:tetratricopeptide (TPR) repeat protein